MQHGNGNGARRSYAFGPLRLDPFSRTLTRDGNEIHLAKRPFDILVDLIENRDRVVSRAELLDRFWDGHDVYDDALRKCIASIRRSVGDTSRPASLIETRYGDGYRFIGNVTVLSPNGNGSTAKSNSIDAGPALSVRTSNARRLLRPLPLLIFILIGVFLTLGFYVLDMRPPTTAAVENVDPISRIRAIAVMPLKNLTGKQENEYFSDGVTDSIITELARTSELKVISRGSTFSLKATEMDPREVGSRLGVDALLEGTVQAMGDLVNIRVRLVDTRTGNIVWTSNDFERTLTSAYDLQDAIACSIAAELRSTICGPASASGTNNGLAYQEYLKGRYEWNKRTAPGILKSIEHFNRAIAIDPNYALAYSGLAESYLQGLWHVPFDSAEALPKAREFAIKAVQLDERLADAHTALASALSLEWKWAESEQHLARAIELNPRYARAHHVQAFSRMLQGDHEGSLAAIDRAAEIDPLNLVISTDKGNLLHAAGRVEDAFRQWDRTIEMDPKFIMAREHRLVGYETIGDDRSALAEHLAILELKGISNGIIERDRQIGKRSGFRGIRHREFQELKRRSKGGERVSPVFMASYCAVLGEIDEAFRWLDIATKERSGQMVLIVSPQFGALHNDPRYVDLIARIGLGQREYR